MGGNNDNLNAIFENRRCYLWRTLGLYINATRGSHCVILLKDCDNSIVETFEEIMHTN